MDIKLKNSRNVRIGIIIIGLLLAVGVNVSLFPLMIRNAEQKSAQLFSSSENVNTEYIDTLYQGAYVLYTEIKNEPSENRTEPFVGEGSGYDDYDYISEWSSSFEGVRSETDYYATDGAKKEVNTNAPLYEVLEPDFRIDDDKEQWNSYESVFVLDFDEDGNLSVDVKKDGTVSADTLIKSLLQADRYNEIRTYAVDNDTTFVPVKNFQVVYGIPKDSTNLAYEDYYTSDYYLVASGGGDAAYFITLLVIAAFACFMCSRRVWKNEKMPDYLPKWHYMEAGIFGLMMSFAMCDIYIDTVCDFPYTGKSGYANVNVWSVLKTGGILWIVFAVAFVSVVCIYPVFSVGLKEYIRQYSFIYQIFPWIRKKWNQFTDEVNHIDFSDKTTKTILKIVGINFLVLAVLMCMWMFGIVGLVIYSLVLFYLMKKYYDRIKKDYNVLMRGVQRIAEGDLDTVITEDIGVFEPFKEQLTQIRTGFKKAVNEEVKSQRMKTELITNVSHDLKTPLTAITTYVELLKKEDITEEERKSYIETLEKKSLRLKVLIEDLFEVSKATTNNITLNLMDVDVVNLMKQVSVEHADKFEQMGLQLRWNVPEEKIILKLDNQKTYRIFENLFVNVQKYAMPNSRVYIDVEKSETDVTVTMRNMSAVEQALGKREIIAEDLGYMSDTVRQLVRDSGFPGMKVLEFAFDSRDTGSASDYLPHNYPVNSVAYTGTHDNETLVSWYRTVTDAERAMVRDYLYDYATPEEQLYKSMIALILRSAAATCIIPMQDWLGLDNSARINKPSTVGQNWRWRLKKTQLTKKLQKEICQLTTRYGRMNWA